MEYENELKFNSKGAGAFFSALMVVFSLVSLIFGILCEHIFEKGSFGYTFLSSFFSTISIIVVLFIGKKLFNCKLSQKLSIKRFAPKFLIPALFICLGMFFGLGFINTLFSNLFVSLGLKVNSTNIPLNGVPNLLAFIFSMCILPSVFEELFFRGVFLSAQNGISTLKKSICVGIFFSLYHLSLSQTVYQFVYGAVLTLLVIKGKSVFLSMICHLVNNLTVILFAYFGVSINFFSGYVIAGGLILLIVGIILLFVFDKNDKNFDVEKDKAQDKAQDKVRNVFLYGIIGIIISLFVIVANAVGL